MFCQVNGIQMYYETKGQGRPVILVHGNGESHEIFAPAVEALSKTNRVITPDSRCHGRSETTSEIHYGDMAEDLIGLIRSLGLQKPVFYGFSDGGILGLLIAIREPELLGKLILSGANLNPEGLKWFSRLSMVPRAILGDPLYRLMLREPDISPADLKKIRVPTVVLTGEQDVIRRSHTQLIADSIPGAELRILPGESHSSYIVNSEKLAPLLQTYL